MGYSPNGANPWRSEILIAPPPLGPCDRLQRLPCRGLVVMDLHQLLPLGADPSPVAHQAHGAEEIGLDHERVEAPDALLRLDPVQLQRVIDRDRRSSGIRLCCLVHLLQALGEAMGKHGVMTAINPIECDVVCVAQCHGRIDPDPGEPGFDIVPHGTSHAVLARSRSRTVPS
jgi:hypothetical protein